MQLELEVTSFQRASLGADAVKVFDGLGGSVGRARTNDWILPDPERFVSSHHAVITYRNGSYFLTDKSTNGIFINESDEPVGNGNTVKIENGDIIQIGQYSIVATLAEDRYGADPLAAAPARGPADDLLGGGGGGGGLGSDTFPGLDAPGSGGAIPAAPEPDWGGSDWFKSGEQDRGGDDFFGVSAPSGDPDRGDIHAAEEKVRPTDAGWLPPKQDDDDWDGAERDHLAADRQQMDLPNAIPEDWDMTGLNLPKLDAGRRAALAQPETAPPRMPPRARPEELPTRPPEPAPPAPPAGGFDTQAVPTAAIPRPGRPARPAPPAPAPAPVSAPAAAPNPTPAPASAGGGDASAAVRAFFAGAGIDAAEFPAESAEEYMRFLGGLFRDITDGVMQVMRARTGVKSSFRMQQTIIGSSQNNPLKFLVSSDEAFESMFGRRRKGFMPPEQAFRASFEDIENHELALMAGMKSAFDGVLREFEPNTLERLFESKQTGRHFLSGKKSNWELYKAFYDEIVARAQDDFQGIFGAEFVRAYEEQIDALLKARKSN